MIYDLILSIGFMLILAGICMADSQDLRPALIFLVFGGAIVFFVRKVWNYHDE